MRTNTDFYKDFVYSYDSTFSASLHIYKPGLFDFTLGDESIMMSSLEITERSQTGSDFVFGGVIAKDMRVKIRKDAPSVAASRLGDALIGVTITLENGGETEGINIGTFRIDEAVEEDEVISITAADRIVDLDRKYIPTVTLPATLRVVAHDALAQCGIQFTQTTFLHSGMQFPEYEGTLTCREVISLIAKVSGTFLRFDADEARFVWHGQSAEHVQLNTGNYVSLSIGDTPVTITGIRESDEVLHGTEGYVIGLAPSLIPLTASAYAAILAQVSGVTAYQAQIQALLNPAIQVGDTLNVKDKDGTTRVTYVTSHTFNLDGQSRIETGATIQKEKSAITLVDELKAVLRAQGAVTRGLNSLEEAQLQMTELLTSTLGGFFHEREGKRYIADHADLDLAQKVWHFGLGGIGYSETGVEGPYVTGLTADKTLIAHIINAGIIHAENIHVSDTQTLADSLTAIYTQFDAIPGEITAEIGTAMSNLEMETRNLASNLSINWESGGLDDTGTATAKPGYVRMKHRVKHEGGALKAAFHGRGVTGRIHLYNSSGTFVGVHAINQRVAIEDTPVGFFRVEAMKVPDTHRTLGEFIHRHLQGKTHGFYQGVINGEFLELMVENAAIFGSFTMSPEDAYEQVRDTYARLRILLDSISLVVSDVSASSGRIDVLTDAISLIVNGADGSQSISLKDGEIVAAVNRTDGVGKVKTVNVTVDGSGLTIDNGALTIRDAQNKAVITSQGLKIIYQFTSTGELHGFQKIGWWQDGGTNRNHQASFTFAVPLDFVVEKAILRMRSLPVSRTGWPANNGSFHARNLRLYRSTNVSNAYIDYPYMSNWGMGFAAGERTDITSAVWGAVWSPTGTRMVQRENNIKPYVTPGQTTTLNIMTTDTNPADNYQYYGGIQFEVEITGYLKGGM